MILDRHYIQDHSHKLLNVYPSMCLHTLPKLPLLPQFRILFFKGWNGPYRATTDHFLDCGSFLTYFIVHCAFSNSAESRPIIFLAFCRFDRLLLLFGGRWHPPKIYSNQDQQELGKIFIFTFAVRWQSVFTITQIWISIPTLQRPNSFVSLKDSQRFCLFNHWEDAVPM